MSFGYYSRTLQCELCNCMFHRLEAEQPDGYECDDGIKRQFCCDGCWLDWEHETRIGLIEAQKQYQLYGDDLDSWYR